MDVALSPREREVGGLLGARRVFGKPFEVDELVGAVEQATLN